MSENSTPNAPKTAEEKAADKLAREQAKRVFATLEEAKANKPNGAREKWTLHRVTDPSGKVYFTWNFGKEAALLQVVIGMGWSATPVDKVVGKEKVAGLLAQLSDVDREAVLAAFAADKPAAEPQAGKPVRKAK